MNLSHTQISDNGIRHLIELPRLEELGVEGIPFTTTGLEHIAELRSLTDIRLVANCGSAWQSMPALKSLHVVLKGTNDDVTIEDVPALETLTVEVKYVPGGKNSLVRVSGAPKLRQVLVLGAGADIEEAPWLETLVVVGNGANESGKLPQLIVHDEFPRLGTLDVRGITISPESKGSLEPPP